MKGKIVTVFSSCAVLITALGTVAGFTARADDLGTAVYNGVNRLRQTCGVLDDDPRLTVAAQRHANDMLKNGADGHIGSDGSSPGARIADAGYTSTGYTGEIVYWGTGSAAAPAAALDLWMQSPAEDQLDGHPPAGERSLLQNQMGASTRRPHPCIGCRPHDRRRPNALPRRTRRTIRPTAAPTLGNPPPIAARGIGPPAGERHYWPRPAMDATQTVIFFAALIDSSDEAAATGAHTQTSSRKPLS
jgi:hypothetical protein